MGELVRVVGDEGEAINGAFQADVVVGRVKSEDGGAPWSLSGLGEGVVVEGPLTQPLLPQQVEVDIGQAVARFWGEPVGGGKEGTVFVDHRLAIPRQICAGLSGTGGRIDVGLQVARRRDFAQLVALAGFSDGDGGAREIYLHDGPGQSGLGGRGDWHPEVLAHLYMEGEVRQIGGSEELVGSEGDLSRSRVRFLSPR